MDGSRSIPVPISERLSDLRRGPLTIGVWLLAAAVTALLLGNRARGVAYVGVARSLEYEVSTSITGRVAAISVDIFDEVEPGQVVALLEDADLAKRLQIASAELQALKGSLEAEAARQTVHSTDVVGELRRFQIDEEQLRLKILSFKVDIESDRVEKTRLDLKVAREEPLAREGLLARGAMDDTRLLRDAVAKRLQENETLLARAKEDHRIARDRRQSFETRVASADQDDPLLRPLKEALAVQELRIEELELSRQSLVLRSPIHGRVSEVLARRGQSVLPGEPLLLVADMDASEILAYVPEADGRRLSSRASVLVTASSGQSAVVEAAVDRVGPTVAALPQRLWRSPATPDYGLPVAIRGIASLKLIPGERVSVRFL